jgi:putative PIN family toxin of toxin-antitoxin system
MIRVVLDTNILISALLNPQGLPAQVFLMTIIDPDTQLCLSGDIFAEYDEVIRRPRFNRSDVEIVATLRTIREKGFWVKPTEKVYVCSEPRRRYIPGVRSGSRSRVPRDRQCQRFSRFMVQHADSYRSPVP